MYCKFCGNKLEDDANFCSNCGKVVVNDAYEAGGNNIGMPATFESIIDEEKNESGGKILKFAILGLAFACSFYLSWLGLAFSIISRVKLKKYTSLYGETKGSASVGKGIGTAAFILSIVLSAILLLYILVFAISAKEIFDILDIFEENIPDSGIYF